MSNLTDFIGAGGGLDPRKMTKVEITTSQNWVAPKAKYNKFFVLVQGAGAGGTAACNNNSSGNYATAFGGLAGGYKKAIVTLAEGGSVSVSIGAGGIGGSLTKVGLAIGSIGGDTTFGNITAKGGVGTTGYAYGNPIDIAFNSLLFGNVSFIRLLAYDGSSGVQSQQCSLEFKSPIIENFYGLETFISTGLRNIYFSVMQSTTNMDKNVTGGENSILGLGGVYGDAQTGGNGVDGAGGGGAVHNGSNAITAGNGGDGKVLIFYEAV